MARSRNLRIELNRAGIRQLLTSREMQADLDRRAGNIAAAAGPGMRADSEPTATRARAEVVTETWEAKAAEARDRSLTRAIDAGRH